MDHPAFTLGEVGQTVVINGSGNETLVAADEGKRWMIFYVYVQAGANTNLTFNSGGTALSGALRVAQSTAAAPAPLSLGDGTVPVFIGTAVNEAITVTNSAAAQLDGFAVVMGVDSQ